MKINDVVVFEHDAEVSPAHFIYEGTVGKIIDVTVPDYYKVQIDNYGIYWVGGKHLSLLFEEVEDLEPLTVEEFMRRAYSEHNYNWDELDPDIENPTYYYNPYEDREDYEPF